MPKYKPTSLLAIKMWNFILFWCEDLSSFLHNHYFCTVFILCKCYYKELVWVIPNSVWNFGYYKIFCEMFFFPSQIYLLFLYCPKFLIPTKVLHTAHIPTKLKQSFLHWTCFCQFCQVIKDKARRVQFFLSHLKWVFLIVVGREQHYTSASLQEDRK